MEPELTQVLLAVVLVAAHFLPFAIVANIQVGSSYLAGPRDKPLPELSPICGRMKRAYENYLESLPWFIAVMLVAHLADRADAFVVTAGWVYLAARLAYLPAYITGVPLLRSLVWAIATGAVFAVAIRLLIT